MTLSTKKCIVIDRGQFLHIAVRLARDFGTVYYYLLEEDPYPKRQTDEIGTGFANVKVIDNLWKCLRSLNQDEDIVAFTDVHNGGMPDDLIEQGFNVVASLSGEEIESNKKVLKEKLKQVGLPVIPTVYKKGITETQSYLKGKQDKWLKISHYRGDFETYHYQNEFLSSTWFDNARVELGSTADTTEIMIEDHIDAICEIGFESPMLNGVLPGNNVLVGYEDKDRSYVGKVFPKLPKYLADVHEKMQPMFKRYRAWYSTEIRSDKHKSPYYNDATCRFGSPPSGLYCELYNNFSETIYLLAKGKLPGLKPAAQFGAEIILHSDFNIKYCLPVQFPKEIDRWVKLKNAKKIGEGKYYCFPNHIDGYMGSVIAIGNNLQKVMDVCMERASMIKAEELEYAKGTFDEIKKHIEDGKQIGVDFKREEL